MVDSPYFYSNLATQTSTPRNAFAFSRRHLPRSRCRCRMRRTAHVAWLFEDVPLPGLVTRGYKARYIWDVYLLDIYNIYIYIIFIHYQMYSTKYPGYRVQGEIIRDGRICVFPSPVVRSNSLQTLWSDHSAGINLIPNIHTALKETSSFSAITKTYLQ